MGEYFVRPGTTPLPIFDGHTITVRTYLTHGEHDKRMTRMYRTNDDGKMVPVLDQIKLSLVTAYLVDWSVTDRDGERIPIFQEPVAVLEQRLNTLYEEEFDTIFKAIEQHVEAMHAARAQEKKQWATAAATTLRLPSDADGVLTGSVS